MVCIPFYSEDAADQKSSHPFEHERDTFASLTGVCIFLVCEHLKLPDWLSCAGVNRHWRAEVSLFCRTRIDSLELVTRNRSFPLEEHHLLTSRYKYLLFNEDGTRMYPIPVLGQHSLSCADDDPSARIREKGRRFGISMAQSLTDYYINANTLKKLVFHHQTLTDAKLTGLFHLLIHLRGSLVTFRLTVMQIRLSAASNRLLTELFEHINSLTRLERLKLEFTFDPLEFTPDLRVLNWLQEFSFYCTDKQVDLLHHSLSNYVETNPRLTRITYRTGYWDTFSNAEAALRRYTSTRKRPNVERVTCRFTHLPFKPSLMYVLDRLPMPLERYFHSLTALKVVLNFTDWRQSMRRLATLTQLLHLEISPPYQPFNVVAPPPVATMDAALEAAHVPRLPSVCTLAFGNEHSDHRALKHYNLGYYFPRLQMCRIFYRQHSTLRTCLSCQGMSMAVGGGRIGRPLEWYKQDAAFNQCVWGTFDAWRGSTTLKYGDINYKMVGLWVFLRSLTV